MSMMMQKRLANPYGDAFVLEIETTTANETFVMGAGNVGTYNAVIDWGDGSDSTITTYNDADLTHVYATAGLHLIKITGTFPYPYFYGSAHAGKLRRVLNVGSTGFLNLGDAFRGCNGLTEFVSGSCNTSAVTDMRVMLGNCSALTTVDLSSFDTALVTNMFGMFYICSSLTSLDLSSFNTSSVTNMSYMLYGCSSLTILDLSSFNTVLVTDMGYMLHSCSLLASLDLSSFNTSSVISMFGMLYSCSSLTNLDLSSFNTSSVTNMGYMLGNCSSLNDAAVDTLEYQSVTSAVAYMQGVTLPTSRYDATLIAIAGQAVQPNVTIHFGGSKYTAGGAAEAARNTLINTHGWTIYDGGAV